MSVEIVNKKLCIISLDSQPWTLKDIARQVILENVFSSQGEDASYPSMKDLEVLENLPLPSILIKYLKYFRDPNQPRPINSNKIARRLSSEDNSDDSIEGLDVILGNRANERDGDDGGDEGGGRRRFRYRIILR